MCCTASTSFFHQQRTCRKCNVADHDSGNVQFKCSKIFKQYINKLKRQHKLKESKQYCQYNVKSPRFINLYGGDKFGIFSAAMPIEALHALENGIFIYCFQIIWDERIKNLRKIFP